jgi:hypothetical protein
MISRANQLFILKCQERCYGCLWPGFVRILGQKKFCYAKFTKYKRISVHDMTANQSIKILLRDGHGNRTFV